MPFPQLAWLLLLAAPSLAQYSQVTCDAGSEWSFNSLRQSPCTVASYLQATCSNTSQYTVYELPAGYYYTGPKEPAAGNECWCSSVTYSLLGACALCQSEMTVVAWQAWTTNCSTPITSNGYFPRDLPAGIAVPAWAYQTFQPVQVFSGIEAQAIASSNKTEFTRESPGGNVPGTGPSSASPSVTASPTPSPQPPSSKSSNAAAIGGGVGGGVGGLLLLAVVFFFWRRYRARKRRLSAPSAMVQHAYPEDLIPPSTTAGKRLYDPSDPSTFPTSPVPSAPSSHPAPSPTTTPSSAYHSFQPVRPENGY